MKMKRLKFIITPIKVQIKIGEMVFMICERCNKTNVIKSGFTRGMQRYKCKDCNLHFIKQSKRLNEDERLRIVRLCSYGIPMHTVAKMFFITTTTVARWVKCYQKYPNVKKIPNDEVDQSFGRLWQSYTRSRRLSLIIDFQISRIRTHHLKLCKC